MSNTVIEVTKMHFQGNITDDGWFEHLKYDNGKPNTCAILILGEIVYWYRATIMRDEYTGAVLGYKKKFKADKLQKSYQALGDRFGFTKRQAKLACDYLKEKGIIDIEFRTVKVGDTVMNNVMFIDIIPEGLSKISGLNRMVDDIYIPPEDNKLNSSNDNENRDIPTPPTIECKSLLQQNVIPPTIECKTNTKTTPKTTPEITLEEEETIKLYEDAKGKKVNKAERVKLIEYIKTYSKDLVLKAIEEMVLRADKINLKYIQTTLEDWHSKGLTTVETVEEYLAKFEVKKAKVKESREKAMDRAAEGQNKVKIDSFNNYDQRDYDFDDLERKLLGWDKQEGADV